MSHDYLDVARYNLSLVLREALQELAAPLVPNAVHFSNATACHRVLAICRLLQDADVEGFARGLCKAGQSRLALLERVAQGAVSAGPELLIASDNTGFSDAVTAGDLDTARAIARLSASRYTQGLEYEEDFLFSRFLHLQIMASRKQLDFDPEVAATVGTVYIDGLALVRLAELASLPVPGAMELLPALARVPLGMRLPAPEDWLSHSSA